MLELAREIATASLLGLGSFFVVTGAIGIIRMPDMFTRMHAAGMIDTLGAALIIAGLVLESGFTLISLKLLVLLLLFFFTSPVASHALARAALYAGLRPRVSDDSLKLADPRHQRAGKPAARR
ncbi:MAG: hypothetical protein GC150_12570 [Rhizobiales bacterium]|nr:hypothetical protein [Hyphomicrobiales bacterium]